MNHYKLREGENIRKPVVKRDRIEIHVPVLLLCLALAFVIWLYVISSKNNQTPPPPMDTAPVTEQESSGAGTTELGDPTTVAVGSVCEWWVSM